MYRLCRMYKRIIEIMVELQRNYGDSRIIRKVSKNHPLPPCGGGGGAGGGIPLGGGGGAAGAQPYMYVHMSVCIYFYIYIHTYMLHP